MKLFLALSSLLFTSSILCQNYLEFPLEEGTTWVIRQDLFDYDQYGNWTFQSTS